MSIQYIICIFLSFLFKGSVLNNTPGESPGPGKTTSKVHQNYEGTNKFKLFLLTKLNWLDLFITKSL